MHMKHWICALLLVISGAGHAASTDALAAERLLIEARDLANDAYYGALSAAATLALAVGELGAAPQ